MTIGSFVGKLTNQNQNVTRFGYMNDEIAFRVRSASLDMEKLYNGEIEDIRRALGPQIDELKKFLSYIPRLELEVNILPITRAILKVQLSIKPNFTWNDRWNGKSEPFWIIVDNESEILHSEFFVLHKNDTMMKKGKKNFKNEQEYSLTFFIPYEV
jgi:pre-mRNA-splicing helicase BRR2